MKTCLEDLVEKGGDLILDEKYVWVKLKEHMIIKCKFMNRYENFSGLWNMLKKIKM
jgi:hypothetical protein